MEHNSTENDLLRRIAELAIGDDQKDDLSAELSRRRKTSGRFEEILDLPWGVFCEAKPDTEEAKLILYEERSYINHATQEMITHAAKHAMLQKANPRTSFRSFPFYQVEWSVDRAHIELLTRLLGRPVETVRFAEETTRSDIFGSASSVGLLLAALKRANCCNPVIFLANTEKIKDKKVQKMITRLIDHTRRHSFADEFIGVPFDFTNVIFIQVSSVYTDTDACTNYNALVNCKITTEKKVKLIQEKILPPILAEFGLEYQKHLFNEDDLVCILDDRGMRRGFGNFVNSVRDHCRRASKDPKRHFPSILYVKYVKKPNMRFPLDRRSLELRTNGVMPVGGATLLGYYRGTVEKGVLNFMQAFFSTKRQIFNETNVRKEMVHIAHNYLRTNAERYRIPEEVFAKFFAVGYPISDGPSAGCATFLSLFSLFTNRRVRSDSATTGAITLSGRIRPIGGVYEKTYAAYKAGIRRIVLPSLNGRSVEREISGRLKNEMKVVYVETVDDLVEAMMEK